MSTRGGRDFLQLVWKDPTTKRRYSIGELSRNGQFEFAYGFEVEKAIEVGFELLIAFPEREKVYKNDDLFPVFASRLPDPKRKGIEAILEKYDLSEYNAYELLKKSGARLPIDNLEFIDPIDFESGKLQRRFFIAGTGYFLGCAGENCENSVEVNLHEELDLVPDPKNEHDEYAVKIVNARGTVLGFLPRYYSKSVCLMMGSDAQITCRVIDINKDSKCLECIKVELTIEKK